jgi:hypothetical protein
MCLCLFRFPSESYLIPGFVHETGTGANVLYPVHVAGTGGARVWSKRRRMRQPLLHLFCVCRLLHQVAVFIPAKFILTASVLRIRDPVPV